MNWKSIAEYWKQKKLRRIARRITKEYPSVKVKFDLEKDGLIEFEDWRNPLTKPYKLNQDGVDFFRLFINKGDVAIDIGANIGDTTVPMAIAAGKEGISLAFDPNPFVFKILEVNSKLNKDKTNIVPFRKAITANEENFYYVSSEASFANGGISPTKKSHHGRFVFPEQIEGINLLKFLDNNYPDKKIKFIKIDAEGYDLQIIKSISDLLKKYRPVFIAESFGPNSRAAKKEMFDGIEKNGYVLFYTSDFLRSATFKRIETANAFADYKQTINVVCVPIENKNLIELLSSNMTPVV